MERQAADARRAAAALVQPTAVEDIGVSREGTKRSTPDAAAADPHSRSRPVPTQAVAAATASVPVTERQLIVSPTGDQL